MILYIISLFLYLVPMGLLFCIAMEIYFRNKNQAINKITALVLFVMMFLVLSSFMINFFPAEYLCDLSLIFLYIPAILILGIVPHFCLLLTDRFEKLSLSRTMALCYAPTYTIIIFIMFSPKWISISLATSGIWQRQVPSFGLVILILCGAAYTMGISAYLLFAGLKHISKQVYKGTQKKQIKFILFGVLFAGVWVYLSSYFIGWDFITDQINFPDMSSFSMLIFAFFVRFAMVKFAFLPPIERKYQILYELSPLAILLLDQAANIHDANPAALKLFQLTAEEIKQLEFPSLLASNDRIAFIRQMENGLLKQKIAANEFMILKKTQEQRLVQAESEFITVAEEQFQYVILRDITESKLAEQRITFLAYHDELTGLSNRRMFHQQLTKALAQTNEDQCQVAVFLMDLDRFKFINDTKGHDVGDLLLKYVANKLIKHTPAEMKISRLGGDEFAMFMPGIVSDEQLHQIAAHLLIGLKKPFIYEGIPYSISASLGICLSPKFGNSSDVLLKNADIAMYFAKNNGRDRYQVYAPYLKQPDLNRLALDARLRKALDNEEFVLHYQPQIDLQSHKITGVEALIRWNTPDKQLVYPAEFIPAAEESGLIIPIGRWVLEQACKDMKAWIKLGLPQMKVSVNISLSQFSNEHFITDLRQILRKTHLDPRFLCLEITERSALENQEYSLGVCREIVNMNVGLSIDDFGIGYSSFSLLRFLTFDAIKIDPSFVKDMVLNGDDTAIIKAIIAMAHGLNQKVVAEGVEAKDQWNKLKDMGCDFVQGYYISEALPEQELIKFIKKDAVHRLWK